MLLPFRWLLYGGTAVTTTHSGKKRKIPLRRSRATQWSEAVAPPRRDVVAPVLGVALNPRVAPVRVSIAAAINALELRLEIASATASIAAPVSLPPLQLETGLVTAIAEIDLFDYEIAALLM